ncbi:hypothetical protein PanWU01x14_128030, partial [Parasponia andersonii]
RTVSAAKRPINDSKSFVEPPPSLVASSAAWHSCATRCLTTWFSPTDSAKTRANLAESGTADLPPHTVVATLSWSTNSVAFANWSAPSGQANIGTPAATASRTEFHPQ